MSRNAPPDPGTKRALDVALDYLREPPPMDIETALASANPLFEIAVRLREPLSDEEERFREASAFLQDTLNGGLIQALSNSTGDVFDDVLQFARAHCDRRISAVLEEVRSLFPEGNVPRDRDARCEVVDRLSAGYEADPFDALTTRFYALEQAFEEGLLTFAAQHRERFLRGAGRDAP